MPESTPPQADALALLRRIVASPVAAYGLALLMVALVATLDRATGYELRFAVLYLAPIVLAAWVGGLTAGVLFVALSCFLWLLSFGSSHPYSGDFFFYWEGVAMLAVEIAFVFLLTRLRVALSRADERFVHVLEELQAAVYVADHDSGRILYANHNLARLLDADPDSLDARELGERFGITPLATPQGQTEFVSREIRNPASGRWYLVKSGPIPWTSRRQVSLQVITEITELKQAQALKRQNQEMLHQTARLASLAEIASTLAHEVNQPLMAIATYNDAGLRMLGGTRFNKDDLVTALQRSREQALRAGKIIRGVRDFIRSRRTTPTDCDINALVRHALDLLETPLDENGIDVALSLSDTPLQARADQTLLAQVILNLAQNAIEAMAKNDPARRKLTIASTRTAEGTIIVSVSDQGRGIPADLGEQPYMPLFTTKMQGMGLGLSICRSVVEAHGGRIWHDKNVDGGCSFHFSLPPENEA